MNVAVDGAYSNGVWMIDVDSDYGACVSLMTTRSKTKFAIEIWCEIVTASETGNVNEIENVFWNETVIASANEIRND